MKNRDPIPLGATDQGVLMMNPPHVHGHRFNQIERLRSPERVARLEVEHVADQVLNGISARSLLDIGTGTGIFAEEFYRRGLTVAGIDANPEMLEAAHHYLPGAVLRQATAEEIPFSDHSFDIVFMGLVLHETDDLIKSLQEARRVASQRVAVLEWPYRAEDFGPGLEERIPHEMMASLSKQAGFGGLETFPLEKLVLYTMQVGDDTSTF
jgi:ubiquinone/menaquinone biosynthesis C-methylase UbiE